jgi:hypothetical protein
VSVSKGDDRQMLSQYQHILSGELTTRVQNSLDSQRQRIVGQPKIRDEDPLVHRQQVYSRQAA